MVDISVNQRKKILTRCIEHQLDSIKGHWESSGASRVPWTILLDSPINNHRNAKHLPKKGA